VPPPAEGDEEVERALKVLGEVFLRNGHKLRDCLRRGSMLTKIVSVCLQNCAVLGLRGKANVPSEIVDTEAAGPKD